MDSPLNNIVLNTTMMENLYGHLLIEVEDFQPFFKYLGGNAKNITILINTLNHTFLPEEQLSVLNRMLLACKINTGDVAIVNMAGGSTLKQVIHRLQPQKIIAFGVDVPGTNTPLLSLGRLNNSSFLNAPDLEELIKESEDSKLLKTRLWTCLRTLFRIDL